MKTKKQTQKNCKIANSNILIENGTRASPFQFRFVKRGRPFVFITIAIGRFHLQNQYPIFFAIIVNALKTGF